MQFLSDVGKIKRQRTIASKTRRGQRSAQSQDDILIIASFERSLLTEDELFCMERKQKQHGLSLSSGISATHTVEAQFAVDQAQGSLPNSRASKLDTLFEKLLEAFHGGAGKHRG